MSENAFSAEDAYGTVVLTEDLVWVLLPTGFLAGTTRRWLIENLGITRVAGTA